MKLLIPVFCLLLVASACKKQSISGTKTISTDILGNWHLMGVRSAVNYGWLPVPDVKIDYTFNGDDTYQRYRTNPSSVKDTVSGKYDIDRGINLLTGGRDNLINFSDAAEEVNQIIAINNDTLTLTSNTATNPLQGVYIRKK